MTLTVLEPATEAVLAELPSAGEHGLRGRLEDGQRHRRSNPRKRSQSVTADSNARSSISARLR